MPSPEVAFSELRDDWYRGADLMARLIHQSSQGGPRLVGFPAQWTPMFEQFGGVWSDPIVPPSYVPVISDLSPDALTAVIDNARRQGRLRQLVEGIAAFDPLVADVLHKLDRRSGITAPAVDGAIPLTGWQSYGRPEVVAFGERVAASAAQTSQTAVLLPCARRRPYRLSKTHKRLGDRLAGTLHGPADEIVISSLGVIPSAYWEDPVVLAYDSGVPDIYRVLRLMRQYFGQVRYAQVVDCLEFEPYRDCLRIIQAEGLVGTIKAGPDRKVKKLPQP
jgi:hypothetical protein